MIDDLRIYDRVLGETEIKALAVIPPPNVAPVVSPGTNQTIIWATSAALVGTVSEDGRPNPPSAIATTWSQIAGPGPVTFATPNSLSTTASFPTPGLYTLRLLANDGQLQAAGTVTINVIPRPAITVQWLPGTLHLSWVNDVAWRLQSQTNSPGQGLTTNWMDIPGSATTNSVQMPVEPTRGSVFYRLVFP